jgi:hypothetical protein
MRALPAPFLTFSHTHSLCLLIQPKQKTLFCAAHNSRPSTAWVFQAILCVHNPIGLLSLQPQTKYLDCNTVMRSRVLCPQLDVSPVQTKTGQPATEARSEPLLGPPAIPTRHRLPHTPAEAANATQKSRLLQEEGS